MSESGESDSSSGPEDRNQPAAGTKSKKPTTSKEKAPPAKKSKTEKKKGGDEEEEEEGTWELGKNRFVSVREWKGHIQVDIREFYSSDGELKPGRKGIALKKDEWSKLKGLMDKIDEKIQDM